MNTATRRKARTFEDLREASEFVGGWTSRGTSVRDMAGQHVAVATTWQYADVIATWDPDVIDAVLLLLITIRDRHSHTCMGPDPVEDAAAKVARLLGADTGDST